MSGALAARGIPAFPGKVSTSIEGDIEKLDGGPIVISRVRLNYHLKIPKGKREEAERAIAVHSGGCPAYTSIKRGIEVEWTADIQEE